MPWKEAWICSEGEEEVEGTTNYYLLLLLHSYCKLILKKPFLLTVVLSSRLASAEANLVTSQQIKMFARSKEEPGTSQVRYQEMLTRHSDDVVSYPKFI